MRPSKVEFLVNPFRILTIETQALKLVMGLFLWCVFLQGCVNDIENPNTGGGSETWGLSGSLVRPNGDFVSGARINLLNDSGQVIESTTSDAKGHWSIKSKKEGVFLKECSNASEAGQLKFVEGKKGDHLVLAPDTLRPSTGIEIELGNSDAQVLAILSHGGFQFRQWKGIVSNGHIQFNGLGSEVFSLELSTFSENTPGILYTDLQPKYGDTLKITVLPWPSKINYSAEVDQAERNLIDSLLLKLPRINGGLQRISVFNNGRALALRLQGLGISILPANLNKLSSLRELNLKNNPLENLPPSLSNLRALEHLNVAECKLRSMPKQIVSLPYLKYLNVSGNPLDSLETSIFTGQTTLEELILSNTQLDSLPRSIGSLIHFEF